MPIVLPNSIQDDATPYKRLVETAAASVTTAEAGSQNLFVDSASHKLSRKNSAGVVTVVEGITTRLVQINVIEAATALTTGDGKAYFFVPTELNGLNLVSVAAMVDTVSSSGTPTIQIRNVTDSVDMLSTRITIDANEKTSYTSAVPAVIDGTKDDVATGDQLAIDVNVAGTGTKGLWITWGSRRPT